MTTDVLLTQNGSLVNFLDAGGVTRIVTLPPMEEGRFYVVANIGAAGDLEVQSANGQLVTTLLPADTALMFASDAEWTALRGWAALAVFTNTVNGLVPAPNSAVPGSLFLRDDGEWAQVQVTGIVDAFKFITDGTNTAVGSGPDTFWLRSSTNKIGITVTNGEAIYGDNANFTVNEANVNHDLLLNFFADEHVGHSTVDLIAGTGLSGGGDITVSRTFNLDLNDLTVDTPVLADTFAFYDVSGTDTNKATFTTLNGILNHNALLNYVADQHVAHSGVSVIAGTGLSGGGDLTTSRTFNLDFTELALETPAVADEIPFYDVSGADHNRMTIATLNGTLDHNLLLNYAANRHIDHTAVTLTAGSGLTGGGDISASRSFAVGQGVGILVNADDVALNFNGLTTQTIASGDILAYWDISASTHSKATLAAINAVLDHNVLGNYNSNEHINHALVTISTTEGIQGGGTIAANRTFKLDINALTADATPDSANDYIVTWDASASLHKKVLITNLPGGLNITGLSSTTPATGDELPLYDVSAAGNRKATIAAVIALYQGHFPGEPSTASAASGEVGEHIMAALAATMTSSGVNVNAGSIVLSAGDWDLSALVQFSSSSGATTTSEVNSSISLSSTPSTNNASSITGIGLINRYPSGADFSVIHSHTPYRVSISTSTTYYVHTRCVITGGTGMGATGWVRARRMR